MSVREFAAGLAKGGVAEAGKLIWASPHLGKDSAWDHLLLQPQYQKWISKTLVYGAQLGARFDQLSSEMLEAVERWVRAGKITAANQHTVEAFREVTGKSVAFTGPPSLLLSPHQLVHAQNRSVFCPPLIRREGDEETRGRISALYSQLAIREPNLFIAHHRMDFDLGAVPGNSTMHSPCFPQHHGTAIASAGRILSGRRDPLMIAISHGVAAVSLQSSGTHCIPPFEGFPTLSIQDNRSSEDWLSALEGIWENYPHQEVAAWVKARKSAATGVFKEWNLIPKSKASRKSGRTVHLCSISDLNYVPFLLGYLENAHQVCRGNVVFHILALDDKVEGFLAGAVDKFDINVVQLKDLWTPTELPQIEALSLGIRGYASKARLLLKALTTAKCPVYYCDSDVYFFDSPAVMEETLTEGAALVFPHWNDVFGAARLDGLYNAGMIAVKPGAERFLNWLAELCLFQCDFNRQQGAVGDQSYLDFAPLMFPEVRAYLGRDQNVARWNLESLGVHLSEGVDSVPRTAEGITVKTYHAAFLDNKGVFEAKYVWDQIVTFFSPLPAPDALATFRKNTFAQQQKYWLRLSRAMLFRSFCHRLFGWVPEDLSPRSAKSWVLGFRRWILPLAASVKSLMSRRSQSPSVQPDQWVEIQRRYLGSDRPSTESPKRKTA